MNGFRWNYQTLGGRNNPGACLRALPFCLALLVCLTALPRALALDDPLSLSEPLTVRWRYETERTVNLTPAVDESLVYLPLASGTLLSLRHQDGQLLWKEETGGEFSAAPLADERAVYVATELGVANATHHPRATGALRALSHKSGITLWMRTLQSPLRGALACNRDTIFGGSADGRVYAIRKDRGEIVWSSQFRAPFASQPVVSGERLYIGGEDGAVYALDQKTGRVLWRYQTRGAVRGPVAAAEGVVFLGSADSYVYALREGDGRLRWRARTGAQVQGVTHTARGLVVASLDNFVYLLSTRRGERVWKRQLAGRIAAQPLATEEGALFAPLSGDACVVLDLKDGKQINYLPVGEGNNMAAAPVLRGQTLLVTTRRGLLAFAPPPAKANQEDKPSSPSSGGF